MLQIKPHPIKAPVIEYYTGDWPWYTAWHGLEEMDQVLDQKSRDSYHASNQETWNAGYVPEEYFQRDCLLSVLEQIQNPQASIMELGAGWGRVCMSLVGAARSGLVDTLVEDFFCLAVEGDQQHAAWISDHFLRNKIKGSVLHGVVKDKNSLSKFSEGQNPAACYGQSILDGPFVLTRQSVKGYKIDFLIPDSGLDHIDFMDMDIQGYEVKALQGTQESLKLGRIDYIMVGTHSKDLHKECSSILYPYYNIVIDIEPKSIARLEGFPPIDCHDGILLGERKGL